MAARSEAEINSLLVYKSPARQGGVLYSRSPRLPCVFNLFAPSYSYASEYSAKRIYISFLCTELNLLKTKKFLWRETCIVSLAELLFAHIGWR